MNSAPIRVLYFDKTKLTHTVKKRVYGVADNRKSTSACTAENLAAKLQKAKSVEDNKQVVNKVYAGR